MERRERRHHTREFKQEAVRLAGLGDKTKAKVARELGIRVTTDSRNTKDVSPNLVKRRFKAQHPNACWLSDVTYIPTREGWLYLAAVLDVYSRAIVGWGMSRKGDCWDNAPMESFSHSLKTELVMHCDYKTRDEARASLFDYMEVFYNRQRRHSSINYVAPLVFEASTTA